MTSEMYLIYGACLKFQYQTQMKKFKYEDDFFSHFTTKGAICHLLFSLSKDDVAPIAYLASLLTVAGFG